MMTTEGDREPQRNPDGSLANLLTWSAVIDNGYGDPIVSVMFSPAERVVAYAISGNGKTFRKDNIDLAANWAEPGQWGVNGVRQLALNHLHSERLYAVTGDKVGRSADAGATWSDVGAGSLPTSEFNSIVAHPDAPTMLFLGADIGVIMSDDEGDHWFPFDSTLPNAEVLQICTSNAYLYAVTHGRGLWRTRLP